MRPPRALPAAHFDRNESHVLMGQDTRPRRLSLEAKIYQRFAPRAVSPKRRTPNAERQTPYLYLRDSVICFTFLGKTLDFIKIPMWNTDDAYRLERLFSVEYTKICLCLKSGLTLKIRQLERGRETARDG